MSGVVFIGALLTVLLLSWAIWFLIRRVRHVANDEEEVDKRLQNVCRSI